MITSEQIRAGRALIKWSADELALSAGVGVATIRRFESVAGVPLGQLRVLELVKKSLQNAGVEFIGTPDDRPGVRLK
ncbi:transcriptional regulator [Methylotenera versatilis]|uniref:transcriptional regulator n=1 Tax=Methylotenera versatilis TaxID=1055487 RepID=UPI0019309E6A|nr:transcriptional regulator [Methylotenera versatilis]